MVAMGTGVEDEVVGPDEVRTERRQGSWPTAGNAPSRPATRELQPGLAPQPMRAMPTELVPLALQEDADPPVAVARILRREQLHRVEHRLVLDRQTQLVGQCGARNVEQPAGASLGQAAFASERNLLAPRLRAHPSRGLAATLRDALEKVKV